MKTVFAMIVLAMGMHAFAGQENAGIGSNSYNAEEIYQALNVKEVNLNPGIAGVGRFQKSVGGLTCTREELVVPNAVPSYECSVDQKKENFAAIYKALKVKEVALNPGVAGLSRSEKAVGGLSCVRTVLVARLPKPIFDCQFAE